MFWVLIKSTLASNEYPQHMFCGEIISRLEIGKIMMFIYNVASTS